MKQPSPADQRRTHDLGFADEGPHDVATLRRLLVEREAEIVRLRQELEMIYTIAIDESRTVDHRFMDIRAVAEVSLFPREE